MCGILGYVDLQGINDKKDRFDYALEKLKHRGPDGTGKWSDQHVILGHRRLSIIDLSDSGSQPFLSNNKKACIVFNGEIYNYKEISTDLTLRSQSDTEVLLEGYLKHGSSFFKRIRGIYAFAIYDFRVEGDERLVLLRDSAGVKPLYVAEESSGVIFSSEIKAILPLLKHKPEIDSQALKAYIHLGYIVEPSTIYKGLSALTPGEIRILSIRENTWDQSTNSCYDFDLVESSSKAAVVDRTKNLLHQAISRNLVADVPVNIALSGGIDSSLVYHYANQIKPTLGITVQMDERAFDETDTAKIYAGHINGPHQIVNTQVDQKLELLNKLLLHFDQPYADSSFIPFHFLSKSAAQYSKVLIGGDSGDEIHNGYSGYRYLPILLTIRNSSLRYVVISTLKILGWLLKSKRRQIKKLQNVMAAHNDEASLFEWHAWFPSNSRMYKKVPFKYETKSIEEVFKPKKELIDISGKIKENYFTKRMISDYLRKSDVMSMYNSLEFRVPMLDEDLVAQSLKIPYHQKSGFFKGQKLVLRKIHTHLYPKATSKLKKKGFTIPLDTWLGDSNLKVIKDLLLHEDGIVNQYIELEYVDVLMQTLTDKKLQQYCSRESAYQRILILYSLQIWYLETYSKQP